MIKAVLFDMDGVLLDSEEWIAKAAVKMFAENGVEVNESDFTPFIGTGEDRYLKGVADIYNYPIKLPEDKNRVYAIYDKMVSGSIEALPGVHDFIEKCKERKLKLAVVTSADRIKMNTNLREIGVPESTFDTTITGSQVERKKPFPDIFLKAAEELQVSPRDCLVVEDAITGIEAGKAAGAKCLGVMTSFTAEELSLADWHCNNLADAPIEAIEF